MRCAVDVLGRRALRRPAAIDNLERNHKAAHLHNRSLLTRPVDRQRTESASDHDALVDPQRSDDDTASGTQPRRLRQQAEILRLLAAQQLHRAADLTHEHLAEFADDHHIRRTLTAALNASADPHLQRRAGEFVAQ